MITNAPTKSNSPILCSIHVHVKKICSAANKPGCTSPTNDNVATKNVQNVIIPLLQFGAYSTCTVLNENLLMQFIPFHIYANSLWYCKKKTTKENPETSCISFV